MSTASDFILITGASRGLGKELAIQIAKPSSVMILHGRDRDSLVSVEQACRAKGAIVFGVTADFTKNSFVKIFRQSLKEHIPSQIDRLILFNNAAIIEPIQRLVKTTRAAQKKIVSVNLDAPIWFCSEFLRLSKKLRPKESYVINISSGVSLRPVQGWSLYCTSKAGINMLTACLYEETKGWKNPVYAIAINPGALDTSMQEKIRESNINESAIGEKFRKMYSNNLLKSPKVAALEILNILQQKPFPNGQFIDMNLL